MTEEENRYILKNINAFKKYVTNNFDINVYSIFSKYGHTFKVSRNAIEIAKSINFDTKLGFMIGLLHDFARFTQWTRYGTYKDHLSIDHGDFGEKLLFEENLIELFDVSKQYYKALRYSIKYHNKKDIDFDYIKSQSEDNEQYELIVNACKISRDADKVDLIKKISIGDMKMLYSGNGVSKEVYDEFMSNNLVTLTKIKTPIDRIANFIAFLYDINFKKSFDLININCYLDGIEKYYVNSLDEVDKATFFEFKRHILSYLSKILK